MKIAFAKDELAPDTVRVYRVTGHEGDFEFSLVSVLGLECLDSDRLIRELSKRSPVICRLVIEDYEDEY